ncbi:hypothetical protein ZIOFF_072206 [Zingiber officinale]|uniref:Uncharacterized protein n=1 Tax=Zingiber officinale TaxID=94328 RepID=A0A8J5CCK1_ZINOF|nr:hypothetical protein ZIOFF_072206 [Zingiber officinale]
MLWRDLYNASNGIALGMDSPGPSVMSSSSGDTFSHSKHWTNVVSISPTIRIARPSSGHRRRPIPSGMNLYPSAASPVMNLSGLNFSGSSQRPASLWIAHTLTSSIVPTETSNPATVQSLEVSWGTRRGAAGLQSKSLVDDAVQVGEVGEVVFGDRTLVADRRVELGDGLLQDVRMV